MHHGTCVTHVPWCMSGSLTLGGGENVPGIPGACATPNFAFLARGPSVTKEKGSGHMTPRDNGKQCTCNHSVPREILVQIKGFTLTTFVYLSLFSFVIIDWRLMRLFQSSWLHQRLGKHTTAPGFVSDRGEFPNLLVKPQRPQSWYQFLNPCRN